MHVGSRLPVLLTSNTAAPVETQFRKCGGNPATRSLPPWPLRSRSLRMTFVPETSSMWLMKVSEWSRSCCFITFQRTSGFELAPRKFEWNFRHLIFKQIAVIDGWGICCEIAPIWMSLDFTDDQSALVQVMAWCRQATSHYLSQCWPRSLSPSGVTRPEWVDAISMTKICAVF